MSQQLKIRSNHHNKIFVRLFNDGDLDYVAGFYDILVNPGQEIDIDVRWYNTGERKNWFQIEFKIGHLFGTFLKEPWTWNPDESREGDDWCLDDVHLNGIPFSQGRTAMFEIAADGTITATNDSGAKHVLPRPPRRTPNS